jgi:hypothetical protein
LHTGRRHGVGQGLRNGDAWGDTMATMRTEAAFLDDACVQMCRELEFAESLDASQIESLKARLAHLLEWVELVSEADAQRTDIVSAAGEEACTRTVHVQDHLTVHLCVCLLTERVCPRASWQSAPSTRNTLAQRLLSESFS